ncbi:MAG: SIMPL domain-containing protein, partial [Ignavibacteriaceae bacterium]|nr:SIMPL domain-containing protein [Ignavibacteriaceae bacterium]
MTEKNSIPLAAAILTIGFLLSIFMLNSTWRNQIRSSQSINVTGSAKKDIVSDFGVLKGTLSAQAFSSVEAYKSLQRQKPLLVSFIK